MLYWNFPRFVAGLFRVGAGVPPGSGCYFDKFTRRIHAARYVDVNWFLRRQPKGVLDPLLFVRCDD